MANTPPPACPPIIVDPRKFDLTYPVRICLYDKSAREYAEIRLLESGEVFSLPDTDEALKMSFKLQIADGGRWVDAVSLRPIVSDRMRVPTPVDITAYAGGLRASFRTDVHIAPLLTTGRGGVPFAFSTVYDRFGFIPESQRLIMGKRGYAPLDHSERDAEDFVEERVIFADPLSGSYGHFLTETLSRLWFARMHPDLPILWMAGRQLSDMQRTILSLLGVTNRHIFVSRPTRFAEVVFPFPGLSLGDFFLPGHADFLGVVEPADIISGKKLYITRSKLAGDRGKSPQEIAIDQLMERFGFIPFSPEENALDRQLSEISSSEIVVGVEGSALHTPILLKGELRNRFIAIGRHRMGQGVFGHIAQRKFPRYDTVDLHQQANSRVSARDALQLDVDRLGILLETTKGFERKSSEFDACRVNPIVPHQDYLSSVEAFRNAPTEAERAIARALRAIQTRDMAAARAAVGALCDFTP